MSRAIKGHDAKHSYLTLYTGYVIYSNFMPQINIASKMLFLLDVQEILLFGNVHNKM